MKKIMFQTRPVDLQTLVLAGLKTRTFRVGEKPRYEVGEVVAVSQSYKEIYDMMEDQEGNSKANEWWCEAYDLVDSQFGLATTPGYRNKMFVMAELMPMGIEILSRKQCRIQDADINEMRAEGLRQVLHNSDNHCFFVLRKDGTIRRQVSYSNENLPLLYRDFISTVCGRDIWDQNPEGWAYNFRVVRLENGKVVPLPIYYPRPVWMTDEMWKLIKNK